MTVEKKQDSQATFEADEGREVERKEGWKGNENKAWELRSRGKGEKEKSIENWEKGQERDRTEERKQGEETRRGG